MCPALQGVQGHRNCAVPSTMLSFATLQCNHFKGITADGWCMFHHSRYSKRLSEVGPSCPSILGHVFTQEVSMSDKSFSRSLMVPSSASRACCCSSWTCQTHRQPPRSNCLQITHGCLQFAYVLRSSQKECETTAARIGVRWQTPECRRQGVRNAVEVHNLNFSHAEGNQTRSCIPCKQKQMPLGVTLKTKVWNKIETFVGGSQARVRRSKSLHQTTCGMYSQELPKCHVCAVETHSDRATASDSNAFMITPIKTASNCGIRKHKVFLRSKPTQRCVHHFKLHWASFDLHFGCMLDIRPTAHTVFPQMCAKQTKY